MKALKFLLAGAVALMAFAGCKKTEELVDTTPVYDDAYYASYASISSSDSDFTSNSTGGTIHFKVSGGEVKVFVSCGTDWLVQNSNPDVFNAYISDAYYLTVSAEQNLIEEELTGTITLTTAEMRIAFASITVTQNAYGAPEITVETNEWNAPAVGKLTTSITVESTDEWTIEGGDEWLTAEKSGTGLNLTAEENEGTEERITKIVLTCTDGYKSDSETITVTQDGRAYVTLSEEELFLPQFGDTVSVRVESNFDYECTYDSDWLTIEKDEDAGGLAITYTTNETGEERGCIVAFTAGDGASNVAKAEIAITQIASSLTVEANEWHAPAVGKLTTEIGVEASYEWEFECDADWLTVEKTETSLRLTAAENTETAERTAEVVLTCTDGTTSTSNTVTVTQDGKAYITVAEEETTVSSFGSSVSVNVESNFEWEYVCDADWVTISTSTGYLKIAYATNDTGIDRECVVVVKAGDRVENVAESEFKLIQSSDNFDALILEYTITDYAELYLPFEYQSVTIDWGDGTTTTMSGRYVYHIYHDVTNFGVFNVTINGNLDYLNYKYDGTCNSLLTRVVQWGNTGLTNMEYAFYGCKNLTSIPEGPGPFSDVTSFQGTFYNCSSLTSLPEGLFDNCTKATTFRECFYGCTSLESISESLFTNCPNVTSFASTFYNCSSLESIPENLFDSCPNVTSFAATFENCSFGSIPDNLFANCPNVASFASTFFNCSSLKSVPKKLFANCPNVTNFDYLFRGCYNLTEIPEGLFDNCPEATNFECTFNRCSNITSIPVNLFDNCTKISNLYATFYNCTSWQGESPYTMVDGEKVHLYERNDHTDVFSSIGSLYYGGCFHECSGLTDYDTIPYQWKH